MKYYKRNRRIERGSHSNRKQTQKLDVLLDISQLDQYSSLSDRGAQYRKETHFAIPSRNIYIPRAIEFVRWLYLVRFYIVRLKVYSFQKQIQ